MKKIFFFTIGFLLSVTSITYSNGVAIVDASEGVYLQLQSSEVNVVCESQISLTTTTLKYLNNLATDTTVSFAFPLPEGASATELMWYVSGIWRTAVISPQPQDTNLPGGTMNNNLRLHLGKTPLFFAIPQQVEEDSVLIVKLTYVQLLPYAFGNVNFMYPDDYRLIQTTDLEMQRLDFSLVSPRTIDSIKFTSYHPLTTFFNNGDSAYIGSILPNDPAKENYTIVYSLNQTQLGLYSYSTNIPVSQLPDSLGGFFTFIAEPDPGNTIQTIKKVFTFILDRSGSMMGDKIVQAKNAATFVTQNLNEGDKFNIIDFETNVYSFRQEHVLFTQQSRDSALAYISAIQAGGLTNISGAFGLAIPQFHSANDSTANIIIFFTDGMPTTGITNTQQLLDYVTQLTDQNEAQIFLYTFGIGADVNYQLLTLLAAQHNGLSEFLENSELYEKISQFYLKVRNPVLLSPNISFSSPYIHEVYPRPLPNLYKGQQMIVSGRYLQPGPVTVTLSGRAFNQQVTYHYSFNLVDTAVQRYQFLTKIWAKTKIEHLLIQYYSIEDPESPEAIALKNQIIWLSINYGVVCPFTSFGIFVHNENNTSGNLNFPGTYKLLGNYPNPFNPSTTIKFLVNKDMHKIIKLRIYNILGQLVKVIEITLDQKGEYHIIWKGDLMNGSMAPSGVYFYVLDFGTERLAGKMVLLK